MDRCNELPNLKANAMLELQTHVFNTVATFARTWASSRNPAFWRTQLQTNEGSETARTGISVDYFCQRLPSWCQVGSILLIALATFVSSGVSHGADVLALPANQPLARIAFGSCEKEGRAQPIWESVVAAKPDVFIFAGDNIYADTRDMKVMRAKYARLAAKPGFQQLLRHVPVLATWDDHDYGKNDSGADYEMRVESQKIFLDFFGEPKGSRRRATPGIYDAKISGPEGKRTQIVLLDTRYFRGPLNRKPQSETKIAPSKSNGTRYAPQPDSAVTVLGDTQWKWLEQQLREPAELRLIVSSIQVVAEDHDAESWSNFPHEQTRLFRLIRDTNATGVIFLSGDVHRGELSLKDAGVGYPIFDLTSSGLTQATPAFHFVWPNRYSVGVMGWGNNFGMVKVDWERDDPEIRLQILDGAGDIAIQRIISLSLLRPGNIPTDHSKRQNAVEEAVQKRHEQLHRIRNSFSERHGQLPRTRQLIPVSFNKRKTAPHRGIYELQFRTDSDLNDPFFGDRVKVTFVRPDGSKTTAEGFYDGEHTFRVRSYCDSAGQWRWTTTSNIEELNGLSGSFQVVRSPLPGKLRKHPDDSRQLVYDNGKWFLHIGDTGYRYVVREEEHWREYIDQAARMGVTKIRTWFSQSRHNVEALFNSDRSDLNLAYWQEIDRRIAYAFQNHPHVMLQLIPFGEDTDELKRYAAGDRMALLVPRYAQARFSAYPNVLWCISNDREIVDQDKPLTGRRIRSKTIDRIGAAMAEREPWGTLLTNHQSRFKGYSFVKASWSDIITLENLDQVTGEDLLKYRELGNDPVVMDEDRYEQYRAPKNPRYFFRRLMWASLLSGGSATYGGLRTYEPHDFIPTKPSDMKNSERRGIYGYYDAVREGRLNRGGDDFVHIHKFFTDAKATLVGMKPADKIAGGNSEKWKCMQDGGVTIVYLANPDGSKPGTDSPSAKTPTVTLKLPDAKVSVRWFSPRTGAWTEGGTGDADHSSFKAPSSGDWVLLLRTQ